MDERYELDRAALEVIRRLDAYADARLDPSVSATTRMRATVMAAAHRQAALMAADGGAMLALGTPVVAPIPGPRAPFAVTWRRPIAAMLGGVLTLGILAGTALATRPGGPLYDARLWTEAANLPAGGYARAQAEVDRLQARLDEAEAAAASGDGRALIAAIDAYAAIVTEAAGATDGDAAAAQLIAATVSNHVAVLTALLDEVPATAHDAIEHALLASTTAVKDIEDHAPPPRGGGNGNGGSGGNAGGGNGGGGNGGAPGQDSGRGNGSATPAPNGDHDASPDPTANPPKATPSPVGHDRSPRPTNSHAPQGQPTGPADTPPPDSQH